MTDRGDRLRRRPPRLGQWAQVGVAVALLPASVFHAWNSMRVARPARRGLQVPPVEALREE
jgi:hypothetical protein